MEYMQIPLFPRREDYPDSFSILDNPQENPNAYLELVESSASAYFQTDPLTRYFYKKRFLILQEYLGGRHFKKSLDVGCGIGFSLPILAAGSDEVVGVDASQVSLEYARFMAQKTGFQNAHFSHGSILELPSSDASCDLVVCMSVLEHIRDLGAAFHELRRVLAPGGLLIIGYPSETPVFRFLHETMSTLFPKRRNIHKIIEQENPSEETFIGHINNGEKIRGVLQTVAFKERSHKSIQLLPPFFELYTIHVLTV